MPSWVLTTCEPPRSYKAPNSFWQSPRKLRFFGLSSYWLDRHRPIVNNQPPLWIHINRDPQLLSLLTAAAAVSLRFSQSSYPSSQSSPWYYISNYKYQLLTQYINIPPPPLNLFFIAFFNIITFSHWFQ